MRAVRVVTEPGVPRIRVLDDEGTVRLESRPPVVREDPCGGYRGDLHGQGDESIGITTARPGFDFAENNSILDATDHRSNDIPIETAFRDCLQTLNAEYDDDGAFVTLSGYEWSGNAAVSDGRNRRTGHRGGWNRAPDSGVSAFGRQCVPRDEHGHGAQSSAQRR